MSLDAGLTRDLNGLVDGLLTSLGEYPEVAPDALREVRDSITGQESLHGAAGAVVDLMWWLDTRDEDEADSHVVVRLQESAVTVFDEMPDERRARLIEVLAELAAAEQHAGRNYELRFFPHAAGLIDDEPDDDPPAPREWIDPRHRT